MRKPSTHQQQTPNLLKPHIIASHSQNHQLTHKRSSVKRLSAIILGALAGSSLPALAFALHSQSNHTVKVDTPSAQLHVEQHNTSLDSGSSGDKSSDGASVESSGGTSVQVNTDNTAATSDSSSSQVTINGQSVPLENGSVHRHYTDNSGANVDVDVTVDGASNASSSNSSSTDISISSSSNQSTPRGSPRR